MWANSVDLMGNNGDEILSPKEMLKLAETIEGRRLLFSYIISARIAYAVQNIFETLGVIPEPTVQQRICEMFYDTLFRVPQEQIFEWCEQVSSWKKEEYREGNA